MRRLGSRTCGPSCGRCSSWTTWSPTARQSLSIRRRSRPKRRRATNCRRSRSTARPRGGSRCWWHGPRRLVRLTLGRPVSARPAVVCIHGHGGNRRIVYDPNSLYRGFAAALAERGFVTISADVGQHTVYEENRTLMGERLWDLMRCVDYLESLPEVDKSRIGCGGLSLGGEMAMWLGGMDTRIAATASCGFLTKMDQMEQNHCLCWKFDGLRGTGRFRRHLCADRTQGAAVPERPAGAAVPIPGPVGRRGPAGDRPDLCRLRPAAERGPAGAPRRSHHQLAGAAGLFPGAAGGVERISIRSERNEFRSTTMQSRYGFMGASTSSASRCLPLASLALVATESLP